MENKLMEVYDKSYNETFNQILRKVMLRDEAKKLLGIIYNETWNTLKGTRKTIKEIETVFETVKLSHGVSYVA